ncbi:dihydropteroate synthase [Breoghania sp. L-A4]|uniref:dihydropteroate synthase n=1 Tax=Breoghania sp. L-A4 TaxID=2304600 RepID=UPI0019681470|nr:dihydropteroate synthase [Breoghania sp. L-A4]
MTRILSLGPLHHALGTRTLVMGILNVTPDSFSDGGLHDAPERALRHARAMIEEGADIIDVGGESTRPGATEVAAQEECDRVLPVLDLLAPLGAVVSIDTYKADVAAAALARGAHVVNDVCGLQRDPGMADVVAQAGVPVVVMHVRREVDPEIDIVDDIHRSFERSLEIASAAGIPSERVILDPGLGFGKTMAQNHVILREFKAFRRHGCALFAGASRKRFIGALTGRADAEDRMAGSLAAHVLAVAGGADIVRVHDVREHVDAVRVADAVVRGTGDQQ